MELKLEFEELYISGTGDIELQSKTVVPTKAEQVIIADEDYTALSKVIVEAIPNEYQDVSFVTATADKVLQGYVFVGADGNTLQGEVPIIESAEVFLSSNKAEYNIPNGYHDGNGRVRVDFEELTATPTKETQEITASENKVLSKVTVLPIPDDYVNKNEVPKPTLNAPLISVNVSNAVLNVSDYRNGNFTTEYLLYRNGEQVNTFTSKSINLTEYMTVEGDETIQVRCAESEFFNESELSNAVDWVFTRDGTPGLTYSGASWTGILESVTDTEIYVASIVNNTTITMVGAPYTPIGLDFPNNTTIILPDTITDIGMYVADSDDSAVNKNVTIVVGAGFKNIGANSLRKVQYLTLDLRKAQQIVTLGGGGISKKEDSVKTIIVKDDEFETYRTATNWSVKASKFIRATDYEAQGGGAV